MLSSNQTKAYLHLQNGMTFEGYVPNWQTKPISGEVVFTTGMTGYDASLTDPSFAGQILVFTYPLMGNYGVLPQSQWESKCIHAAGVIVSEDCKHWSHAEGLQSLRQWLETQKVGLLLGVDTRQITKIIREHGTMAGVISTDKLRPKEFPVHSKFVSISEPIVYGSHQKKIIAVDCGMKDNILRCLQRFPLTIRRVPHNYDYTQEDFDGVFLSNGPGDPESYVQTLNVLEKALQMKKPIFGICLGVQLLALSTGAQTYKLKYGHRGQNQPCMDLSTKRCYITSQNHGYAIKESSLNDEWCVSFRNLNDQTVEGISHKTLPLFGVQFHPEAAPGPTDTEWLFEKFYKSL